MRYEEKIIKHTEVELMPFNEAIANIEFSTGDLIQLRDILREFKPNLWAKELLSEVEKSLEKIDIY